MTPSNPQRTTASAAPRTASRTAGALLRAGARSRWVALALLALVAVAAFFLGRSLTLASVAQPLPTYVGLPAGARLVWYDTYVQAHEEDWTYAVPGMTNESLTAFYQAQLPRDAWRCLQTATMTNITRQGTAYTGTSDYITAWRGATKAQIYTANQQYGAFLLQGDLPANAVALKITLLTEDQAQCA